MTVKEAKEKGCSTFYNLKGRQLSDCFIEKHGNWSIMCSDTGVKAIAPKEACEEFMRDTIGTIGKGLYEMSEISMRMGMYLEEASAWLWSCAYYGLTQREFVNDFWYWVIE